MPRRVAAFRTVAGSAALWLSLAAAPSAAAGGGRPVILPEPGSAAWTSLSFPAVDRETRYETVDADGRRAFRADAECSASARVLPLEGVDLERTPVLAWSWRVERGLENDRERTREGDDFAARVYVTFPEAAFEESLFERLRRALFESFYGERLPRCALCYVWASGEPAGSEWPSPYTRRTRIRVLRASGADGWRRERVDVAADFARAFGDARVSPSGVAVMTDTDDTCGAARAYFADFRFEPRNAGSEPSDPRSGPR